MTSTGLRVRSRNGEDSKMMSDFQIHSSDGGSRGLPFDPADAAGVKSGTVTDTGKQEGRTGSEVGASQTPGSSMSFGPAKPITAEQAFGPSETPSQPPQAGAVPVAWRYRWKLEGEWVNWRVADHTQKHDDLKDLEEIPLYTAPPAAPLVREVAVDEIAAWLIAEGDTEIHMPIPASLVEGGRRYVRAGKTEKHSGDCTNESHSCVVCGVENARLHARQMVEALAALSSPHTESAEGGNGGTKGVRKP